MDMEYSDTGNLVYFTCDLEHLFNTDLSTSGVIGCVNAAYAASKKVIPVDTGLMKSSYTMKIINSHTVTCYFDPAKILGKTRKGQRVVAYYPAYLLQFLERMNWLDIVMTVWYNTLYAAIKKLKHDKRITAIAFGTYLSMRAVYDVQYAAKVAQKKAELAQQAELNRIKVENQKKIRQHKKEMQHG